MEEPIAALPQLPPDAHKGRAGRVLCLCGSRTMPGAAILVVRAAQRAGAGLVTLGALDRELLGIVPVPSPETVYLDLSEARELFTGELPGALAEHEHHARVVGPGLGAGGRTRKLLQCLLEAGGSAPLVVDADGLNVVAPVSGSLARYPGTLVITPHPGEAARLLARDVPPDDEGRAAFARDLAERTGAMCVLKGPRTVVTDGRRTIVNGTGNAGMATAGSGDVLAGILGAYLAQVVSLESSGWSAFDAVASAVRVHGRAGDLAAAERGQRALVASDLIEYLPAAQR